MLQVDWIPMDPKLGRKPEVVEMARLTGRTKQDVVGWLLEIWGWAQDVSADGKVELKLEQIVAITEGKPRNNRSITRAMLAVNWLEDHGDYVVFPRADKWITKGAKARLQKNLRQSRWRENKKSEGDHVDADVDAHVDVVVSNRIEEKRIDTNTPLPPSDAGDVTSRLLDDESTPTHPTFTESHVLGIYELYPRKAARAEALNAIRRSLSKLKRRGESNPVEFLTRKVKAFAASPAGSKGKYTPHAATWFNRGSYDDPESEWHIENAPPPAAPLKSLDELNQKRYVPG